MEIGADLRTKTESEKIWVFAILNFLLGAGVCCGLFSSQALMVSRTGVFSLFYIYLGSSLLSLALAGLLYFLIDRFPRNKVVYSTFIVLGVLVLLSWVFLRTDPATHWPYIVVRIFLAPVFTLTNLQFWLVASDSFNHFEAKRRFPLFVTTAVAGEMVGCLAISLASTQFPAVNFILVWALILMVSPLLLRQLGVSSLTKKTVPGALPVSESKETLSSNAGFFSGLSLLLFIFWALLSFLIMGVDYVFNAVALDASYQEDSLASLYGKIGAVANLLLLLYQQFLAPAFLSRYGIYRSVFAITGLVASTWFLFILFPSLPTIIVADAVILYFIPALSTSRLGSALNLYPEQVRGRIKIFSGTFSSQTGTVLIFLIGMLLGPALRLETMKIILSGAAASFLFCGWYFRGVYFRHLMKSLRSSDPTLLCNAVQALGEPANKAAVPALRELMGKTDSLSLRRNIILSLGRIQSREALEDILSQFLSPNEFIKLAVVKALTSYHDDQAIFALLKTFRFNPGIALDSNLHSKTAIFLALVGKKMNPFLLEALRHEDLRIRASAVEALGLLRDKQTIPILLPFLSEKNPWIRANAAVALYSFRSTRGKARDTLDELFKSDLPLEHRAALHGIGVLRLKKYRKHLRSLLDTPNKHTLVLVTAALARMKDPRFCATFVQLLLDPSERFTRKVALHLKDFPSRSCLQIFEYTENLPEEQQKLVMERIELSNLDLPAEREMESIFRFR